jgi:uncharacterized protein (DUF427 family)
MKAVWNGKIIAQSENTIEMDGLHYFPPGSIKTEFITPSDTRIVYTDKGEANYYHIAVDGQLNFDAAYQYPSPEVSVDKIRNYFAFWKGVKIYD